MSWVWLIFGKQLTKQNRHLKGLLQEKYDVHIVQLRDYFAELLSQDQFVNEAVQATNL